MISVPTLPNAEFPVPATFSRVVDVAYNMWWSWHASGRSLWTALDVAGWERYHNPIEVLASIDRMQWRAIEQIEDVREKYTMAVAEFDRYMTGRETWYDRKDADLPGPVAYFCTEYGIHDSLPFYSGGLGILAGDHAKSASDLGIPFVGIGLLFRRGYFRQEIDMDGEQQHIYPTLDLRRLPIRPVAGTTGGQLKVVVPFPGREITVAVWKLEVGRTVLLLLDTDIPENHPSDRPITHQLYTAGREMRFCQELILGVGGVKTLAALGIEPSVYHVNEGHAAMSVLERLAARVHAGQTMEAARRGIVDQTIFTLHTPVPAGNEIFDAALASRYLQPWADSIGVPLDEIVGLASSEKPGEDGFDLGALAIRFASIVNGVSKRHGDVVVADWSHLIDGTATSVTNGVHTPTWIGRDAGSAATRSFGLSWPTKLIENPEVVEAIVDIPAATVWRMHENRKEIFVRFARGRLRRQLARHGISPDELRAVDTMFPQDRLTLGFARRFATYKRATLMFRDRERLRSILLNPDRPVQIVFAGKAHPADKHGQAFIREITELSRSPEFKGHVYMLEDYDARIARFMVQGVDVWVNNPRPPMEASGTSGMKAAINGTMNFSVLDGWWIEGFNGKNGWAFGSPEGSDDWEGTDQADVDAFYRILADEIAPMYYERNGDDLPHAWIEMMREAIKSSIVQFSTHRMVAEYADLAYFPLGVPSD